MKQVSFTELWQHFNNHAREYKIGDDVVYGVGFSIRQYQVVSVVKPGPKGGIQEIIWIKEPSDPIRQHQLKVAGVIDINVNSGLGTVFPIKKMREEAKKIAAGTPFEKAEIVCKKYAAQVAKDMKNREKARMVFYAVEEAVKTCSASIRPIQVGQPGQGRDKGISRKKRR